MTINEGSLVIKSHGVLNFYYCIRCKIEKLGEAYSVSFTGDEYRPFNVLALSISPTALSALMVEENEDELPEQVLNVLHLTQDNPRPMRWDFQIFRLILSGDGAEYVKTEKGVELHMHGFLTKSDRKTEKLQFVLGIYPTQQQ